MNREEGGEYELAAVVRTVAAVWVEEDEVEDVEVEETEDADALRREWGLPVWRRELCLILPPDPSAPEPTPISFPPPPWLLLLLLWMLLLLRATLTVVSVAVAGVMVVLVVEQRIDVGLREEGSEAVE